MKLLSVFIILCLVSGCTISKPVSMVMNPEEEMYFPVEPNSKTRIVTHHVEIKKFSPIQKSEFEQAMAHLSGKCWFWAVSSYKEHVKIDGPDYCVRFVNFTNTTPLKPYKREPTDKKMFLTALNQDGSIRVQFFIWDGKKLQRVLNSESKLSNEESSQDRFAKFMVRWSLK